VALPERDNSGMQGGKMIRRPEMAKAKLSKSFELTAAQAAVIYMQRQFSEFDGDRQRLVAGMFGIFGHGNVAGMGQALDEYGKDLPFYQPKNEQAMVHAAIGFAKAKNRKSVLACTASIGPGSTNMLTGAATATVNRIPVLLFASDIFSHRRPGNVLQQLEHPIEADTSVNDCFRPVSRFFDRISRPEQLLTALPEAMRVLTDPAETGAVTISFPQDVQGEAFGYPAAFFEDRTWRIRRRAPNEGDIAAAVTLLRKAKRPMVIAGGGVRYSEAQDALCDFCNAFGIPVAETFAGKGTARSAELLLGGVGVTGTGAAGRIAETTDLVLCVGTRLQDFATGSRSGFHNPHVRFIGVNVNAADAHKLGASAIVGDARLSLEALTGRLKKGSFGTADAYRQEAREAVSAWKDRYSADILHKQGRAMSQGAIVRLVNEAAGAGDVVIAAAGTPPGEILKAWDNSAGSDCFLEFGFSCMGHEIPAGIGARIARPDDGEIYVVIGDGTYLLSPTELVTAAQEGLKITVVLIENSGYQCIRDLQEGTTGTENFGNEFRRRGVGDRQPNGAYLEIDYAANARSMGATTFAADQPDELQAALVKAKSVRGPVVIVAKAEKRGRSIGSEVWWDVGVAATTGNSLTREAVDRFLTGRKRQRTLV
jgi:3D-(3,5/4)-trihydroxycyclohexane-1,2-dione acylhydrolase (decyclizing)